MKYFLPILGLFLSISLQGQMIRTVYQTLPMPDSIRIIEAKFPNTLHVEEWSGSRLLIEIKISLDGAGRSALDYLVKAGRYELLTEFASSALNIRFKKEQHPLLRKGVELEEEVVIRLYVPKGTIVNQPIRKVPELDADPIDEEDYDDY